ncbi:hypothetical protein ABTY53_14450 [Streptomyces noursei]|uniref:hypothetical protein n=1 Tax=Streptomyces noursei TaxID=1971 RepID=UPI003330E6AD
MRDLRDLRDLAQVDPARHRAAFAASLSELAGGLNECAMRGGLPGRWEGRLPVYEERWPAIASWSRPWAARTAPDWR